jgi:hypothetical protein
MLLKRPGPYLLKTGTPYLKGDLLTLRRETLSRWRRPVHAGGGSGVNGR